MSMQGKTVLITGTSRGIGKELVTQFAKEHANVIAHARKRTDEFETYLDEVANQYGVTAMPVYFDMTDADSMKQAMKQVFSQKIHIDVLVNNAGIAHGGFFAMTKVDVIRQVFEVNLFAAMELTQLVLRDMMRHGGAIVNLSSIAGFDLKAGNSAYGASKAAVAAWTETLGAEVAAYGIRVNAVAPGLIETDMAGQMERKAGEEMVAGSAMKRLGKSSEIANAILYLTSDKASFVNGQTLIVNGGFC